MRDTQQVSIKYPLVKEATEVRSFRPGQASAPCRATLRAAVSMSGIKLSTGETVGAWSLDVIDGKRDDSLEPSAAHDPGAVSSTTAEASADADTFGNRMMENLYYMKMKAKLKADEANKADKGKKKEGKKKALPASAAPVVIPEAMVSDKGGEVTLALTLTLTLALTLTLTLTLTLALALTLYP